jgi:hypothetical protein
MAKRSSRRRGKSLKNKLYFWIGGTLILAVGGIVVTLFLLKPEKVELDAITLCPAKDGPTGFTAIVIDRTDSFGSISKADVEVQLQDIIDRTKESEQVSLFAVEPTEEEPLRSLISVCNPGSPDKADEWTQNPSLIKRNWKTKFQGPLGTLLNGLLIEEEAPLSPIMESIQSVSITNLGGKKKSLVPRRIILISDLLQNSQTWSLYKQKPDFNKFSEAIQTRGLNPDLRGVSIELFFLQRKTKQRVDEKELLKFWLSWVEAYGGKVTRVLKISGMNG